MEKKNKTILIVGIIASLVILPLLFLGLLIPKTTLKIFHAGSLAIPFEEIEKQFEADYPDVDVQLESAGSVQCVNKITEIGKIADVLAVADYSLIPTMPSQYQNYYIKFAKNKMVLAYTQNSKYADEINSGNFYKILRRDDVKWGFSNPNLDPCGYRSPMVLQLAEIMTGDSQILDDLITSKSDITVTQTGNNYRIKTPEDLGVSDENLVIRDKSVDLVSLLKSGGLDYAFEYLSVAVQHELNVVLLDTTIDLSNSEYNYLYQRVTVLKSNGKISTGKAINYGITIPKNANNPELAEIFVEYIINPTGQQTLLNLGQKPISPCPTNNFNAIPSNLKQYCVQA